MSNFDQCPECVVGETSEMICCSFCNQWFHYACVGLEEKLVAKIKDFSCDLCIAERDKFTTWKGFRPTGLKKVEKATKYFEVKDIISWKWGEYEGVRTRLFTVRWKGYSHEYDTVEPEKHLDGCLDKLQEYLRIMGQPYSQIDGLVGSSSSSGSNESNWVSVDHIFSLLKTYKDRYFPSVDLKYETWNEFGKTDQLYLVKFESHCFMVLYYAKRQLGIIADGGNIYRTNEEMSIRIRSLLKIRLRGLDFNCQSKADHCGSSAVLIGLELIRLYQSGHTPDELISPCSWREDIVSQMHREYSESLRVPVHQFQKRMKCSKCGKSFRGTERRSYHQHVVMCSK